MLKVRIDFSKTCGEDSAHIVVSTRREAFTHEVVSKIEKAVEQSGILSDTFYKVGGHQYEDTSWVSSYSCEGVNLTGGQRCSLIGTVQDAADYYGVDVEVLYE